MSRYRRIVVGGSDYAEGVRYAVQEGGAGGRLIGEAWGLDRDQAETLQDELSRAYDAGTKWKAEP